MNYNEELDFISNIFGNFTNIEQKLSTTYRELIGILNSLTRYENINFGIEHIINALNDNEAFFSPQKNPSLLLHTAQM